MRKKGLLGIMLLALLVVSGYVAYISSSVRTAQIERMFTGYLMCRSCATAPLGIAADGVNVLKNPENHSVQCLKMPSCVASGFGMMIKNNHGNYTYYPFDQKGSDLAYQSIISKSIKKDNLMVTVTGKLQKGLIVADGIHEK